MADARAPLLGAGGRNNANNNINGTSHLQTTTTSLTASSSSLTTGASASHRSYMGEATEDEPYTEGGADFASRAAVGDGAPGLSWQATASVVKCVVGGGSFYLPYGVANAGVVGGALGLVAFGAACAFLSVQVMRTKRTVFPLRPVQLDDLAEYCLGKVARVATTVSMVVAGAGGCAVYLVTLSLLLSHLWPTLACGPLYFKIGFALLEIGIACLPSFRLIAFTAVLGDICLAVAVIGTLAGGAYMAHESGGKTTSFAGGPFEVQDVFSTDGLALFVINRETLPAFFASAAFLFAVPSLLFPIENSLREPRMWWRSSNVAYSIVTLLNAVFAVAAYLLIGRPQPFVISSLPSSWWSIMVRVALLVDLAFTFNLTLVPSREILEQWILGSTQSQDMAVRLVQSGAVRGGKVTSAMNREGLFSIQGDETSAAAASVRPPVPFWKRALVRALLILGCLVLAIAIPNISDLIAVGTSAALSWMTFVVTPLCILRVRWMQSRGQISHDDGSLAPPTPVPSPLENALAFIGYGFTILFGIAAGIATTYLSAVNVIADYSQPGAGHLSFCGA